MTHRTGDRERRHRARWLPWAILALVVVFVSGGFDRGIPLRWTIDGFSGLIPLIVFGAVAYFLWTWWYGDDAEEPGGSTSAGTTSGRASHRHRRHGRNDHATQVLRARFAAGEIDEEEYRSRKQTLDD